MASSFEQSTTKTPKKQKIRTVIRNAVEQDWTGANVIPDKGELVYSSDVNTLKIGDGVTTYTELPAISGGGSGTSDYVNLTNKPSINNVTLIGNKTSADLGFATVATTGAYDDLIGKPTLGTMAAESANDYTKTSSLSSVAISGSYNDLIDKPTLGTAAAADTSDFATAAQGDLADTAVQPSDLATVATSGNYNDLTNKPTIPTVNNPTITFTQGGVTKGSITLNQVNNDTIALDAGGGGGSQVQSDWDQTDTTAVDYIKNKPTALSDFTNDEGFISGITSSDVTSALGYTPYDDSNPDGYQANVLESVSVNNVAQSIVNKNVNITVPTSAADVNALPDSTKYAANLSMTINNTTYVVTAQLKDQDGNNIGNAQTIDLPLESVVVSGSYDSQTKEVVLTLQGGSTIRFSVADLVSGLQSEITAQNPLSADLVSDTNTANKFVTTSEKSTWNGKQDALVSGTNIKTINNESILGSGNIDIAGGSSALGDLTDVTLTNPTAGQTLMYNGTNWYNSTSTASVAFDGIQGSPYDNAALTAALDAKQDLLTSANAGTDIEITGGSSSETTTVTGTDQITLEDAVAETLTSVVADGKTEQSFIPSEYTRMESIGMNTQHYIDTGVKFTTETARMDVCWDLNGEGKFSCGAIDSDNTHGAFAVLNNYLYIGSTSIPAGPMFGQRYMTVSLKTYIKEGAKNYSLLYSIPTSSSTNIVELADNPWSGSIVNGKSWLFGRVNSNNTILGNGIVGNIYYLRLWDNDKIVFDGVPVKRNSDNKAGFYDLVSKRFVINENSAPAGYTRLSYIQGDGTAYLDLNTTLTQDDTIELEFESPSGVANQSLFGYRASATSQNMMVFYGGTADNIVLDFNNSNYAPYRLGSYALSADTKYKATMSKYTRAIYQGNTLVTSNTTTCPDIISIPNVYLFAGAGSPSASGKYTGKIYGCKVSNKLDLIPVKKNAGNKVGMYDLINDVFYEPASGTFTAGTEYSDFFVRSDFAITPTSHLNDGNPFYTTSGIIEASRNLADISEDTIRLGYWINSAGNWIESSSNFAMYKPIPVVGSKQYTFYGINKATGVLSKWNRIAWYDSNDQFLSNCTYTEDTASIATAPSGAAYARLHCNPTGSTVTMEVVNSFDWVFQQGDVVGQPSFTTTPYKAVTIHGYNEQITDSVTTPNTAIVEALLKCGDVKDTQNILSGLVTKNIGVLVLDGTEDWTLSTSTGIKVYSSSVLQGKAPANVSLISNVTPYGCTSATKLDYPYGCYTETNGDLCFQVYGDGTDTLFSPSYLAKQYARGNAVIVLYPLATPTTESVTAQTLDVEDGDNTLTVSGSLLTGLGLAATYGKHTNDLTISFTNDSGYITYAAILRDWSVNNS